MVYQDKIVIKFFFQENIVLSERMRLKKFLSEVLNKKGNNTSGNVRVIFCSDEYLLQINREYLKHDFYTDIITFPFTDNSDKNIDAELYISVDRVRENAKNLHTAFKMEIHRVIFHGILHLCGFGDKTKPELKEMRKAEDNLLRQYFKINPQ